MSRLFWDTNVFIYLFEEYGILSTQARQLRTRMLQRRDELITSTMTLAEIQVGPIRKSDSDTAVKLREAILNTSVVVPFDVKAADIYAQLRGNPAIRPPDAIQLSCAASAGVELFITNDSNLYKLSVPGIHFISSLANAPVG